MSTDNTPTEAPARVWTPDKHARFCVQCGATYDQHEALVAMELRACPKPAEAPAEARGLTIEFTAIQSVFSALLDVHADDPADHAGNGCALCRAALQLRAAALRSQGAAPSALRQASAGPAALPWPDTAPPHALSRRVAGGALSCADCTDRFAPGSPVHREHIAKHGDTCAACGSRGQGSAVASRGAATTPASGDECPICSAGGLCAMRELTGRCPVVAPASADALMAEVRFDPTDTSGTRAMVECDEERLCALLARVGGGK